ncbi:hypothetical protein LSPCS325_20880 [Lysinibacillus sp. CTST325]
MSRFASLQGLGPGHEGVITGCEGFSLRSSVANPQGVAQSPLQSTYLHSRRFNKSHQLLLVMNKIFTIDVKTYTEYRFKNQLLLGVIAIAVTKNICWMKRKAASSPLQR